MRGRRKRPYGSWAEWDAENARRQERIARVYLKADAAKERALGFYRGWLWDKSLQPTRPREEK